LALERVDIFGMQLGKTALVVRSTQGKIKIDPIDSTLNGGRLHLEPTIITDTQNQTWLHLGPSSGLVDAVVNDEVSHRVLSFAAPVLDQATRVRGRVSLAVSDIFLPLDAGSEAAGKVDGDVLFDAVEFVPGPLADQLLAVFRQERRPLLALRDPVSVRIMGRRVYQEGLVIPVANVAAIGLEGWIDFDQNLNLNASFALVPPRRNIPILSDILTNTQIRVPITGTLQKPRLNGEAIKENFKKLGVNVIDDLISAGTGGLGRILQGGPQNPRPGRDFFPPFAGPDADQPPEHPPQRAGGDESRGAPQPSRGENANSGGGTDSTARSRRPPLVPGPVDGSLDVPASQPEPLTAEERRLAREERRLRRLEKRAERRMRRGLP
jgi:translocation and assembly module TamB